MKNKDTIGPPQFLMTSKIDHVLDPLAIGRNKVLQKDGNQHTELANNNHLTDSIDFSQLNSIFQHFLEVVGVTVCIIDLEARLLACSNWQALCLDDQKDSAADLNRCIESYDYLAKRVQETKAFVLYRCCNGLTDSATPIIVEGQHIANLFIGQFYLEQPDSAKYQQHQTKSADNSAAYLKAMMSEIPVIAEKKLASIVNLLSDMVKNIVLQHINERLTNTSMVNSRSSELQTNVFISSQEGMMFLDADKKLIDVNPAFTKITGFNREQVIGQPIENLASSEPSSMELYEEIWRHLSRFGSWKGEIWWKRKTGELYPARLAVDAVPRKPGMLQHYVALFSDISQLKEREAELKRIAHYDILTGIPNRHLLGDRLLQAMARINRTDKFLAVCYFDLDGFKPVNDRFGHAAGDQLLITTTARLQKVLRANDTLARIGGDEFVLLFSDLTKLQELEQILERTMSVINTPVSITNTAVSVTASIGVTIYPTDSTNADALLRHADQAMYRAKSAGKNCYYLFDPITECNANNLQSHIDRLVLAFKKSEFVLQYQPKIDLITGQVFGVEALIRWQHPEKGLIKPATFLNLMHGQDLEIEVGEWVISSSLNQLKLWNDMGIFITVSVNISADHLLRQNFPDRLAKILASYPTIDPSDLELEILESATLTDLEFAGRILSECRKLGVRFALDDFGSGHSSLTFYRDLTVETLKIDESFVRDMLEDQNYYSIVESVIKLGQAFNRRVIAGGVESMAHGAILVQMGCRLAQGFGIAMPMFADELPDWLVEWKKAAAWKNLDNLLDNKVDVTLNMTAQNYRKWLKQFSQYLTYPKVEIKPDLEKLHLRFERWYYGSGTERYGAKQDFQDIAPLHELVHDLADELTNMAQAGNADVVKARLPDFNRAYGELLARLDTLILGAQYPTNRKPTFTN
jgi:diguanylate cyclase (GGDEF)-like protein/PAS domain S-box-containing protein